MSREPHRSDPHRPYWDDTAPTPAQSPSTLSVQVTENPVTGTLLGPDGRPLRQMTEREPVGYRLRPTPSPIEAPK